MSIKAIILGSTGMVGQGLLLECIEDPRVESVLLVNRRTAGVTNNKVKEIIHHDFYDFSSLAKEFANYNACFFCLGVSAVGMNEEEYSKITFDITIAAAKACLRANPEFTFCYVSGAGTNSTEKGLAMWARVKGKTENTLLSMPFKNAYMFRPGFIQPMKGITSRTKWYRILYAIFKPFFFVLKPFKEIATDSSTLGRAMINITIKGYPKKIIESTDINIIGSESYS
jgi:uncharacterized protein YbjT (DUF2867 family)